MPIEPGPDLRVLMAAPIVEDYVDDLPGCDLDLDGVEEPNELLMPETRSAQPPDRSRRNDLFDW
jgi:hypothetical protein